MTDFTGLLYARPSICESVGRLLDWSGSLNQYNTSKTPEESDRLALASDWYAIGDDMRRAIIAYRETMPARRTPP